MISGYFFAVTFKPGFKQTALKKIQRLAVPVICWSLLFGVVACAINDSLTWSEYLDRSSSFLWFLKSAFFCSILGFFAFKGNRLSIPGILITLLISQTLSLSSIAKCLDCQLAFMYPCFLAGILFSRFKETIYSRKLPLLIASGILFFVLASMFDEYKWGRCWHAFSGISVIAENPVSFLTWRSYRILMGLSGSLFFILSFTYLFKNVKNGATSRIISKIGRETMGIYILQLLTLEIIIGPMVYMDSIPRATAYTVILPAISIAIVALCMGIISLLKTSKTVARLTLGIAPRKPLAGFAVQVKTTE